MKKVYAYVLILLFCTLLILPTLLSLTGTAGLKTMETQQVAPTHGAKGLYTHLKAVKQYCRSNFGGRNELIYLHSLINYGWLGQSPIPDQVILGKDGWLFAGDHLDNVLKQHQGLYPLQQDEAERIASHLRMVKEQLAKRGIHFYVMVVPDAHSIYPEKLPAELLPHPEQSGKFCWPETPLDALTQAMAHHQAVPYLDLRDTLLQAKQQATVYQQTDTHWNSYGALVGTTALSNEIRVDFPNLATAFRSDYVYQSLTGPGGDLAGLLMMRNILQEKNLYWIGSTKGMKATRLKMIDEPATGLPTNWMKGPDDKQPSLLLFGDSCSGNMLYFLAPYFNRSCFVRQSTLDWQRIETEKPDVVVVEIVERNIRHLERF